MSSEGSVTDRRSHKDVEPVRNWVTGLRVRGADFSKEAAVAAREAAWMTRQSGGSLEDAFQSARHAYYEVLSGASAPAEV
ncbi:MAG: hypothetical protein ACLGHL_02645 [Actinomycetota bacterium]